jgi:predicted metal-dependent enzyme (double-stranded beta helix superfamily)
MPASLNGPSHRSGSLQPSSFSNSFNQVESIETFVATIESLMDAEPDTERVVAGVQDALKPLLRVPHLLTEEQRASWPDRYRSHVVAVAPSRRFSVVSLVWLPGQATPIHDHICWCVVGVLEGQEYERRYSLREDDTGNRWLVQTGEWFVSPGGVTSALIPPEENIHRVHNAGDQLAISLHIYGDDISVCGSSINERFDDLPIRAEDGAGRAVAWRRA